MKAHGRNKPTNMHCIHVLQPEMVQITATTPQGEQYTVIFLQDEYTNSATFEDLDDLSMYPASIRTKVHNRLRRKFPEAYQRYRETGLFLPYAYVFVRHPPHQRIHD